MPELSQKEQEALRLGQKMMEVTDTHRCISNEWYGCYPGGATIGFWTTEEIASQLDKPQYASIRWRYLRTDAMNGYDKVIKRIPVSTLIDTYNTLCRPIYTDFTEVTENLEFLEISGFFYYQLFLHESVYVSYNFFRDGGYIINGDIQKDDLKYKIEMLKQKGGFEVWVKLNEDPYDRNVDFMHIETGITVKIPNWREKVINVKWGGQYQGNFKNWFNLAIQYLSITYQIEHVLRLAGKRVLIPTSGKSERVVDRLKGQLASLETDIHIDAQDNTLPQELSFVDGELLKEMRNTAYHVLDRLMAEYGRVANTNPKGERMTTMEQYKDISAIANRQKDTLEQLVKLARKAKQLWKVDLEFSISGIPEKEALMSISHRAQNPNMEKEWQWQVEGTLPRKPVGVK